MIADDELLGEPFGDVRRNAAGILADKFDFLAGNRVAVLLDVKLDAVVELGRGVGELAGIGQNYSDFHRVLRMARGRRDAGGESEDTREQKTLHFGPPVLVGCT